MGKETTDKARAPKPKKKGKKPEVEAKPAEIGGRGGLEPTRYGDWEVSGKCVDF